MFNKENALGRFAFDLILSSYFKPLPLFHRKFKEGAVTLQKQTDEV